MSYARKPDFDQPDFSDIERMRRFNIWFLPILFFQQASLIFGADRSALSHYLGLAAWAGLILVEIVILSGWKLRWLSDRDNALLNDEWHRAAAGDASRWGLAAMATLGVALIGAEASLKLDGSVAIFILVNGGMFTAGIRYAWLNRDLSGDPDE